MSDLIGVLDIDKPRGLTSHDVVARVRKVADMRRVGHAGTLDPLAKGVLVVCLGKATRLIEYLMHTHKSYVATVEFGTITNTWDAEGEVVERNDVGQLSCDRLEKALDRFRGPIEQVPPMYSALKHQGKPLYRLARKGIEVERESRSVEIHRLEIIAWHPPNLVIEVECSKGTYIRSLAYDLGKAVGPGAYLSDLVRTAVGPFCLEQAVPLERFMASREAGSWQEYLLSVYEAFDYMPRVIVDEDTRKRIGYGQAVSLPSAPEDGTVFAYDDDRRIIAVLSSDADDPLWRPRKVLRTN